MTTPELPGAGSPQTPPQQSPQPYFAQQGPGAPMQMPPHQPIKAKQPLNVPGLIALITAALGFIFACIPGALIVGWILLPIAFVLALVSLFLRDKAKWMGITALITSIVGTIIGVIVFVAVVASSVHNALGSGSTTVVPPSAASSASGTAAPVGTRENPYPIGSTITSKDWRVKVNSVILSANDQVAAANQFNKPPADGSQYILVNYSATYIGNDPKGQTPAFVSIEYVTASGNTVNELDNPVVAPQPMDISTLYTNATATGNKAIEVPTAAAAQGVLAVQPGMLSDKIFVAVK